MIWVIWLSVGTVCLYSGAFAVTLWKQKNKPGSIVVFLLSAVCLSLTYIVFLK